MGGGKDSGKKHTDRQGSLSRAQRLLLHYYTVHYSAACPQQCLYFLPEPQGQGSLRPIFRSA
jgi:hypothetical protein